MKNRRMRAALLSMLLIIGVNTAAADGYRVADGNRENAAALLTDLVRAYETPSADDASRIDADLEKIRACSEADYEIAAAIAEHWRSVYLDPGYTLYMYGGEERADPEQMGLLSGENHAIVVLGYELKNGEMTEELIGRCKAAAALARALPEAILVCSGGATGSHNPEKHTEAGLMKQYLKKQCGIASSRIFIDEQARDTIDNAVNAYAILRRQGVQSVTIVTSGYHQRWGQAIYHAVGALYRQKTGYSVTIKGNYCFDIPPEYPSFLQDDCVAAEQLGEFLGIPAKKLEGIGK